MFKVGIVLLFVHIALRMPCLFFEVKETLRKRQKTLRASGFQV